MTVQCTYMSHVTDKLYVLLEILIWDNFCINCTHFDSCCLINLFVVMRYFHCDLPFSSVSLTSLLPLSGGHVTGCVQQVTVRGAPLDVLCDMLPVFEPVEQLVCLDIKDPQEVCTVELATVILPFCVELLMTPLHCRARALTS